MSHHSLFNLDSALVEFVPQNEGQCHMMDPTGGLVQPSPTKQPPFCGLTKYRSAPPTRRLFHGFGGIKHNRHWYDFLKVPFSRTIGGPRHSERGLLSKLPETIQGFETKQNKTLLGHLTSPSCPKQLVVLATW